MFRSASVLLDGTCVFRLADPPAWEDLTYYARERVVSYLGPLCRAAAAENGALAAELAETRIVDDLGIVFATWSSVSGPLVIPHP